MRRVTSEERGKSEFGYNDRSLWSSHPRVVGGSVRGGIPEGKVRRGAMGSGTRFELGSL